MKINIIANYVGRLWTAILGIILIPLNIKFLGIEAYGMIGFYLTLNGVLGILDLGIGATMNRELASLSVKSGSSKKQIDLVRTIELVYWGLALFMIFLFVSIAPFIADSFIKSENIDTVSVVRSIQLMALSIAFQFPISLYQGGLMGLQRQVLVNIILVVIGTLRGLGGVLVLWLISPTIVAFFVWQVGISIFGSLIFYIAIWKILPNSIRKPRFDIKILKNIWKYAAAISLNAIIGLLLTQLDKILLIKLLPLKVLGYYFIASSAASAIWSILHPFNSAIFPKLVQLHEKKNIEQLSFSFHQYSQILSFIILPISATIILFSRQLLMLWIKDAEIVENSYLIMSFLSLGIMFNGLASLPGNCANAFGWPMLVTYTNLTQAIVMIPLMIMLVRSFGALGASIAWALINSTYIVFMVPYFFRSFLHQEKQKWYIKDILIPLVISFLTCYIIRILSPDFDSRFWSFMWIFGAGIITLIFTGLSLVSIREYFFNVLKKQA